MFLLRGPGVHQPGWTYIAAALITDLRVQSWLAAFRQKRSGALRACLGQRMVQCFPASCQRATL